MLILYICIYIIYRYSFYICVGLELLEQDQLSTVRKQEKEKEQAFAKQWEARWKQRAKGTGNNRE